MGFDIRQTVKLQNCNKMSRFYRRPSMKTIDLGSCQPSFQQGKEKGENRLRLPDPQPRIKKLMHDVTESRTRNVRTRSSPYATLIGNLTKRLKN